MFLTLEREVQDPPGSLAALLLETLILTFNSFTSLSLGLADCQVQPLNFDPSPFPDKKLTTLVHTHVHCCSTPFFT